MKFILTMCAGYLLTALDWTALGLTQSREQVSIVLVLVLYALCFMVTMFSAKERRHRSLKLAVTCNPEATRKLINNLETTSDPGYESDEEEVGEDKGLPGRTWPRVTADRIVVGLRRCGPGKILTSIPKIIINVILQLPA